MGPAAPGWGADPSGRHQYRYFDGALWTEHVADDGRPFTDPLPPLPAVPVPEGVSERPGLVRQFQDAAARRKGEAALATWAKADETWRAQEVELMAFVDASRTFGGLGPEASSDVPVQLKKGERTFAVLTDASLIEPRRGPGHYQGGYSGFSFKVAKGVRYHAGGSRGTYVQGDERPTPIDQGTATVTNQRAVFQGTKQAREWSFAKLLGIHHDPNLPLTAIAVSNRQKVSGILYDDAHAAEVRFRLSLAVAHFSRTVDDLTRQLEAELSELRAARPIRPGTTEPSR